MVHNTAQSPLLWIGNLKCKANERCHGGGGRGRANERANRGKGLEEDISI
jgi:hypothetical protein